MAQHRGAVLATVALLHADRHPLAVDVADLERDDFVGRLPRGRFRPSALLDGYDTCRYARLASALRARKCLFPQPCYWERKAKLSDAERKRVDALCQPLRKLLDIGSKRDAEGLWLF